MSYNGTVRCGYCYRTGHNARTCPQKAQMHKDRWQRYTDAATEYQQSDDQDSADYYVKEAQAEREKYERMTKTCIETGDKLKRKQTAGASLKKMKCSYCGKRGHTRRTCQNLKNDYEVYKHMSRVARRNFLKQYNETGAGIGSLVSVETWNHGASGNEEYAERKIMGMLTEINWAYIDCDHHVDAGVFFAKTNFQLGGGRPGYRGGIDSLSLCTLTNAVRSGAPVGRNNVQVYPSGSASLPPAGWMDTFKPIKEVFDPKQDRPWFYQYGNDESAQAAREALGIERCAYPDVGYSY